MKLRYSLCLTVCLLGCQPSENLPVDVQENYQVNKTTASFVEEYAEAANLMIDLSPNGIAIGEVHGQREGVEFTKAAVEAAVQKGKSVVLLLEIAPSEAGLNTSQIQLSDFRLIDITEENLPFWTDNSDMRATWELYDYVLELRDMPEVEVTYLLDPRLNPPPNKLKAHGLAERWHIAKQARPDSYLISLSGNYHTSINEAYPLDVTNSLCRYLDETYKYTPTCVSIDHKVAAKTLCETGVLAEVIKGGVVNEPWDYVIWRPDRCTRKSNWSREPRTSR